MKIYSYQISNTRILYRVLCKRFDLASRIRYGYYQVLIKLLVALYLMSAAPWVSYSTLVPSANDYKRSELGTSCTVGNRM